MSPYRIASAAAVLLCAGASLLGPVASAQTPSPSASASVASSPSGSASPSPSAPAERGLALLLSAEPATVALGERTLLVAQVTNTGDAATPATSLTITLPPELELESSFPEVTSTTGETHTFELGPLERGASAVAQVTVATTALVEDAIVGAAATDGAVTAEDATEVSVTEGGGAAGLRVSSRARAVLTQVGSMLRYEVVVSNDGDADLENVLVVDVAPAEVDVVSVDIVDEVEAVQIGNSGGRHDIVWNVGSLPAGTSVELPWEGRAARAGDLKAVNSVRGLLGTSEATRSHSESFLAAEGPRELANPPFEPIEKRVVTFRDPPAGDVSPRAATQPGTAVLPFTGAAPWQVVRAGALLMLGGLLLVLGTRLAREPRKALVAALLAGLLSVACVTGSDDDPGDAAAPAASPRTFATGDPTDEGEDGTRVKGERIVRGGDGEGGGATPGPTAPAATPAPATDPPATAPPTATPPPALAAPATAPPATSPVRVVRIVRTGLEDLPVANLPSREGDNTISFGWDEAVGITSASSGTRIVRGSASELLTDLAEDDGRISNRMTLRNTAEAARLRVRGRLVHEVYEGTRLVARLRSDPIDVVLAPGGEVRARFSYLLPTGDYAVEAAFVSSQ